jgi:hypothetical protein
MYFPTRSASGFVLVRIRLWTLKSVCRQENKRSVHSALGNQKVEGGWQPAIPHSLPFDYVTHDPDSRLSMQPETVNDRYNKRTKK